MSSKTPPDPGLYAYKLSRVSFLHESGFPVATSLSNMLNISSCMWRRLKRQQNSSKYASMWSRLILWIGSL